MAKHKLVYATCIFCGYDKISRIFWMGGGVVVMSDILVVKLPTGFEAFVPSVKDFTHGVSVVILDGDA